MSDRFSFLHSLGTNKSYQIHALIHKLVKLKGENCVMEYKQEIIIALTFCYNYHCFVAPADIQAGVAAVKAISKII